MNPGRINLNQRIAPAEGVDRGEPAEKSGRPTMTAGVSTTVSERTVDLGTRGWLSRSSTNGTRHNVSSGGIL